MKHDDMKPTSENTVCEDEDTIIPVSVAVSRPVMSTSTNTVTHDVSKSGTKCSNITSKQKPTQIQVSKCSYDTNEFCDRHERKKKDPRSGNWRNNSISCL